MIKNRFDYKLLNTAIIVLIIYLMYHTGNLWLGIFAKIKSITFPFILSFIIAYALHPLLKWLTDHKVPKTLAVFIILGLILGIIAIVIILVVPMLFHQSGQLVDSIIAFVNELPNKVNFDFESINNIIGNKYEDIINYMSNYLSNGAIKVVNVSMSFVTNAFFIFSATIYFLIDMDNIRNVVKKLIKRKSKKLYKYFSLIDKEMKSYLTGILKVMIITLFEYSIAYKIIGHPDALLLGFLATIGVLIPYFGGMATNVVAAVTAFVVSPSLFLRTVITFAILSEVDGYLINPHVYGKTNHVHPLIVIFSVFAGGILFGIVGIMISFPMAVIIISTMKYFKEDISDKITDIKEKKELEQELENKELESIKLEHENKIK